RLSWPPESCVDVPEEHAGGVVGRVSAATHAVEPGVYLLHALHRPRASDPSSETGCRSRYSGGAPVQAVGAGATARAGGKGPAGNGAGRRDTVPPLRGDAARALRIARPSGQENGVTNG